jgi:ABC-2 type transport system permease protein
MNNFLSLFRGSLLRAKIVLIVSLAVSLGVAGLSIVLTMSSGQSDNSSLPAIKIGFVDMDGSASSKDMARYMSKDLNMELVRSTDQERLDSELVEKRISGIVKIPKGFESALLAGEDQVPAELTFLDDYANEIFVRGYIGTYMSSLAILSASANGNSSDFQKLLSEAAESGVTVNTAEKDSSQEKKQSDMEGYGYMIGFYMMFTFMMSMGLSSMLFEDRVAGTYRRIRASRTTSVQYVAAVAAIGFVISLTIEGPSLLLYSLSGAEPGVPMGITVLLLFVFSVFVIALGLFTGIIVTSMNAIVGVTIAVANITSMCGGAWFPVENAPKVFQYIGLFTPQHWIYEVVRSYQEGSGGNIVLPIAIVLLAAMLFFVLAGVRFASNRNVANV